MTETFDAIHNDIEIVRTETKKERNTQFRIGGVLKKILDFAKSYSDSKPTTYESTTNPELNNKIKDGDSWIYTGIPLTKYERVSGVWISMCGNNTGVTIYDADIINCNGAARLVINCNGDRNIILKSKN